MDSLISLVGLAVMIALAYLLSEDKKSFPLRVVISGVIIQLILALFILKTEIGQSFFVGANTVVNALIEQSDAGAAFLFGEGFREHFFAFKVLPTIIFVSSVSYLLFYFGILQKVVQVLAYVMQKIMGISGAEALCSAANIFVGQTEAPLLVKPYIHSMTRSEIASMMTGGMATVAGGVLAAYVGFGIEAGHLLAASIMSAPAAILIAKVMVPEREVSKTIGNVNLNFQVEDVNFLDAACTGAREGLKLSLNVGAMLIAFVALVAMVNSVLGFVGNWFGFDVTLEYLLGFCFQPFAWIMGVPWSEAHLVGELLGQKTVLNEFIAYNHLGELISRSELSKRSTIIATYALCGFANFSSIAIQIGGIGNMVPERKIEFAKFGFRSMIGGTLAAFMTACIAGALV